MLLMACVSPTPTLERSVLSVDDTLLLVGLALLPDACSGPVMDELVSPAITVALTSDFTEHRLGDADFSHVQMIASQVGSLWCT